MLSHLPGSGLGVPHEFLWCLRKELALEVAHRAEDMGGQGAVPQNRHQEVALFYCMVSRLGRGGAGYAK